MLLDVADITVAYGGTIAVHAVSLSVEPGQVVALVGPNGAGKTSLVRAVCGLTPTIGGTITIGSTPIGRWSATRRARYGIGLVPEGRRVFARMTVRENLLIPIDAKRSQADDLLASAFDLFPALAEAADKPAGLLSGGQQQMLAVGRALMLEPGVLLLDEPTMGLAPLVVEDVLSVVRKITSNGAGVLVADESAKRILPIADHVHVMQAGRVAFAGPTTEEDIERSIEEAYFG